MLDNFFCLKVVRSDECDRREKKKILKLGINNDGNSSFLGKGKHFVHKRFGEGSFVIIGDEDTVVFFFLNKIEHLLFNHRRDRALFFQIYSNYLLLVSNDSRFYNGGAVIIGENTTVVGNIFFDPLSFCIIADNPHEEWESP